MATGRKSTVKAGGEACNVRGDVGENAWCGLVVIGDLKQNKGQMWYTAFVQPVITFFVCCSCVDLSYNMRCSNVRIASMDAEMNAALILPTLVRKLDSSQIVKPAQSTSPLL